MIVTLTRSSDREEAKNEDNIELANDYDEEEDDEWEQANGWGNEAEEAEDVKDEGAAYLEFLNEEVICFPLLTKPIGVDFA